MLYKLLVMIFCAVSLPSAQAPTEQQADVPRLLSAAEDPTPPQLRTARNKIFHGGFSVFEDGPPPLSHVHPRAMEEMPLKDSDVVVVGDITGMQPFLTDDGKALYAEYSVTVLDTIKASRDLKDDLIVFLRRGGAVRLPTGRIVKWIVTGEGDQPIIGGQYLFFLKYRPEAEAYLASKMWLIQNEVIKPVSPDDQGRASRGESEYDGMDLQSVLVRPRDMSQ